MNCYVVLNYYFSNLITITAAQACSLPYWTDCVLRSLFSQRYEHSDQREGITRPVYIILSWVVSRQIPRSGGQKFGVWGK